MSINNKANIRKEILSKLRKQDNEEKKLKSEAIKQKLFSLDVFKKAHVVMFYMSMDEEVNTRRMIRGALEIGKKIVVPYSEIGTNQIVASVLTDLNEDLENGPYGIEQPKKDSIREIPLEDIDLIIVPGVAFDKNKNRIGRGKGYYDRFLKKLPSGTITIGVCFDFQLIKDLPKEPHDLPVSKVITNL